MLTFTDHLFTLQNLRTLLEHTLSMYVDECRRTRPKKSELNRHEIVFKDVFMSMAKDLVEFRQSPLYRMTYSPRLDGLLEQMEKNQETPEFTIHRFVLAHRYPNTCRSDNRE